MMKRIDVAREASVVRICNENEAEFYSIVKEYLPNSSTDKMKKYYVLFGEAYLALMQNGEMIGVAFGWYRKLEFPDDESFMLDGIAIKSEYQKKGYGKILINAFEKSVKIYNVLSVTVGSAGGYVEKFYMECGYYPIEYKVWQNDMPIVEKTFADVNDYLSYERKSQDGFVVMKKDLENYALLP